MTIVWTGRPQGDGQYDQVSRFCARRCGNGMGGSRCPDCGDPPPDVDSPCAPTHPARRPYRKVSRTGPCLQQRKAHSPRSMSKRFNSTCSHCHREYPGDSTVTSFLTHLLRQGRRMGRTSICWTRAERQTSHSSSTRCPWTLQRSSRLIHLHFTCLWRSQMLLVGDGLSPMGISRETSRALERRHIPGALAFELSQVGS